MFTGRAARHLLAFDRVLNGSCILKGNVDRLDTSSLTMAQIVTTSPSSGCLSTVPTETTGKIVHVKETPMRKDREEAFNVSVDAEDYKYLRLLALSNGQSITGAIASLVREREDAEPLTFKIIRVIGRDGEMYDVTVNGKGTQVCFSNKLDFAIRGLAEFRKKHGYDDRRFKLENEVEVLDLSDFTPSEQITLNDVKRARVTYINTPSRVVDTRGPRRLHLRRSVRP
jgi:hypothetical protein